VGRKDIANFLKIKNPTLSRFPSPKPLFDSVLNNGDRVAGRWNREESRTTGLQQWFCFSLFYIHWRSLFNFCLRFFPKQVEFYFSDSNLPRDNFLKKTVSESEDGSILLLYSAFVPS